MPWYKISAKFDGHCIECNGKVNTGDQVFYSPEEKGVKHVKCDEEVGKTLPSYCYRLSKLLWKKNVREKISEIANDMDKASLDEAQRIILHKWSDEKALKETAWTILSIKKQYPKIVEQLANAANQQKLNSDLDGEESCVFFKHTERLWHVPQGDGKREAKMVDSFVLFLPKFSRVVSFESSEQEVQHEQFGWGSLKNVHIQPAFGKLKAVSNRKTQPLKGTCDFDDLRFIFRTMRDAKTVYDGMRLDDFSFASTGDADADAFKMANYFALVGKVVSVKPYKKDGVVDYNIPASVKQLRLIDSTDEMTFRVNWSGVKEVKNEIMDKTIDDFFSTEPMDRMENGDYLVAIARWSIGDQEPEIMYMKNIGHIDPTDIENHKKLTRFYLLAYLNTRKVVDLMSLHASFPDLTNDEMDDDYILVDEKNAYFLQYNWNKENASYFLNRIKRNIKNGESTIDACKFLEIHTVGNFFGINTDAVYLYSSDTPEATFTKLYNARESTWPLIEKEGSFVAIGNKDVDEYVKVVKYFLKKKSDTTRIVARGAKIPKALEVANTVLEDERYVMIGEPMNSSNKITNEDGTVRTVTSITITIGKKEDKPEVDSTQTP